MSLQAFFKKGGPSSVGGEKASSKKDSEAKQPSKNIPWVEKYRPKVRIVRFDSVFSASFVCLATDLPTKRVIESRARD